MQTPFIHTKQIVIVLPSSSLQCIGGIKGGFLQPWLVASALLVICIGIGADDMDIPTDVGISLP